MGALAGAGASSAGGAGGGGASGAGAASGAGGAGASGAGGGASGAGGRSAGGGGASGAGASAAGAASGAGASGAGGRCVRSRRSRHKGGSLEGRADGVRVPTHVVCRECGGVGEGKRGRSEHPGDRSHGERLADVLQQRSFRGCARRNKPSDVGGCLCSGGVDASDRAVSFGHDSGGVSRRPGCCPTATRRRRRPPQPPLTRGSVDSIFNCLFWPKWTVRDQIAFVISRHAVISNQ